MKPLAVFEHAMTFFDPALVQFAADLKWLEKYGATIPFHFYFESEIRRRQASDEDSTDSTARSERESQRNITDERELESRHNFGKEQEAFAGNPAVAREMEAGMNRLPMIVVEDQVVFTGKYPSREQLAKALGIEAPPEELSPAKALACPCKPWI